MNRMTTISTTQSLSLSWLSLFLLLILFLIFFPSKIESKKTIKLLKELQLHPYKPVYGLPYDDCLQPEFRVEFNHCEEQQRKRWNIKLDDYVSECVLCVCYV